MILLAELPEETELELRMRYGNDPLVLSNYLGINLSRTLIGYLEIEVESDCIIHLNINGRKFLPVHKIATSGLIGTTFQIAYVIQEDGFLGEDARFLGRAHTVEEVLDRFNTKRQYIRFTYDKMVIVDIRVRPDDTVA